MYHKQQKGCFLRGTDTHIQKLKRVSKKIKIYILLLLNYETVPLMAKITLRENPSSHTMCHNLTFS